jgi:hypothetical protein
VSNTTPELFGVPVAVLALIVAGAGFLISVFSVGWQIAKHLLDGGRVKVQLNAASWEPGFMLAVERSGRWTLNSDGQKTSPDRIEVAQLVVENPGRTPVTVYSPGIAIEGDGTKHHRISPRMFDLPDMASDSAVRETVVRIEPYDRVTFLLDYWSLVPGLKAKSGKRGVILRGVVEVAGKSKPRKSPRRRAWNIRPNDWTSYRNLEEISPRTVMFRPLYVSAHVDENYREGGLSRGMLGGILFDAMKKFEERPSREEFQAAMEVAAKDYGVEHPIFGVAVWNMYEALDQHAGHLGPWMWRPKPVEERGAAQDADGHESTTKARTSASPDTPVAPSGLTQAT